MKYRCRIPFNKPYSTGKEQYYIAQSILSGHSAGDGGFTKKCCSLLQDTFHAVSVFLTPSCTSALEMAAMLINIHPGDEVIMPSYTFVSTANAFYVRGAQLIFADIDSETGNIEGNGVYRFPCF
jgi:dTDP-4-amino-4,6-dideoxygalactose transaminase